MSEVQMSNSFGSSDNLLDQSNPETTAIVELADEQLEAIAGGAPFQPSRVEESPTFFGIPLPGVSTPLRPKDENPNTPKMPQGVSSAADAAGAIFDGIDAASKFGTEITKYRLGGGVGRFLQIRFPTVF